MLLTEFVLSVLAISFVFGFISMLLWNKESSQWKIFLFIYTFLPALICIGVFFNRRNTWSLGDFSFVKFDMPFAFLI